MINRIIAGGALIFVAIAIPAVLLSQQQSAPDLRRGQTEDKPNIIIITIDSLRADHVGCYGYYRDTTPNIDAFGREAVVFKNAVSQAPNTSPSMASFIVSKYSSKQIITEFFRSTRKQFCMLNPSYQTLPQILKKEQYSACFISDHEPMFYIKGLRKGFDNFIAAEHNNPGSVTETALKWINNNRGRNFFIWLHYFGPHFPYHPNKASMLKAPLKEKDKIVRLAKDDSEIFGVIPVYSREKQDNNENLNYYINNYDGKILLTDEQIGVLLKGLKGLGLDKNSIIVITSDHGEEFGEHSLYCDHGGFLYNTLIHVPLLIRIPYQTSSMTVDETVGLIDVVPTVLDLLKISKPEFDGESLVPLIGGKKLKDKFVFSEGYNKIALTCRRWKLIHDITAPIMRNTFLTLGYAVPKELKEYELYNLAADPYEKDDLSKENSEVFHKLRNDLAESEKRITQEILNKKISFFRERTDERSFTPADNGIKRLKSLGYLN